MHRRPAGAAGRAVAGTSAASRPRALADAGLRGRLEAAVGASMGDLAGAAHAYAARTGWGKDPFTRGAYVNFEPGQLTKFGGLLWVEEDDGTREPAGAVRARSARRRAPVRRVAGLHERRRADRAAGGAGDHRRALSRAQRSLVALNASSGFFSCW